MEPRQRAAAALAASSRTFAEPIRRLPLDLRQAVTAAYLCLRALDEIEDHPSLAADVKAALLRELAAALRSIPPASAPRRLEAVLAAAPEGLPAVSLGLDGWAALAPAAVAPRVVEASASMAGRMAAWVDAGWAIRSEADLDAYTYAVAGAVGLLLADLVAWHDGTRPEALPAIAFGRGLQAANMVRNRDDDLARGADFFPDGWDRAAMAAYARTHLQRAEDYFANLAPGPIQTFCRWPHALAMASLRAAEDGRSGPTTGELRRLARRWLATDPADR